MAQEKKNKGYEDKTRKRVLKFMKKHSIFTLSKVHRGIKPRPDWNSLKNIIDDFVKEKKVKVIIPGGDRTYYKYIEVEHEKDTNSKTE